MFTKLKIGDEIEEDRYTRVRIISINPLKLSIIVANSYVGWTNPFHIGQEIEMKPACIENSWIMADPKLPWYILSVNEQGVHFGHYR